MFIVAEGKVSISAGADTFTGEKAVVWLKRDALGDKTVSVWCYVSGRVSAKKYSGTRIDGLNWETIENGKTIAIRFETTGEVFVTAKKIEQTGVSAAENFTTRHSPRPRKFTKTWLMSAGLFH